MSTEPEMPGQTSQRRLGFFYGVAAYAIWGILPLYFVLLAPAGAMEVVAWRIALALVVCAVLLTVTRAWHHFRALLKDTRLVLTMAIAGVLIYVNWQVYVFAALSGHVVEAALGYFINPLVTVLLGVFVLRERLRPAQWWAIGISFIAVLVLTIGYGQFPWISVVLAGSFGLYGLVKNRVGPKMDAVSGLTLETLWLLPVAVGILIFTGISQGLVLGSQSGWHTFAILISGAVTAAPLLFFAGSARRLPLSQLGLLQYLAPILQFIVGVVFLHEQMPPERWAGFILVWVALAVLVVDMLVQARRSRA